MTSSTMVRSPRAWASAIVSPEHPPPQAAAAQLGGEPMAAMRLFHPRRAISITPAGAPSLSYTRLT